MALTTRRVWSIRSSASPRSGDRIIFHRRGSSACCQPSSRRSISTALSGRHRSRVPCRPRAGRLHGPGSGRGLASLRASCSPRTGASRCCAAGGSPGRSQVGRGHGPWSASAPRDVGPAPRPCGAGARGLHCARRGCAPAERAACVRRARRRRASCDGEERSQQEPCSHASNVAAHSDRGNPGPKCAAHRAKPARPPVSLSFLPRFPCRARRACGLPT
jgi:hypothetical protein